MHIYIYIWYGYDLSSYQYHHRPRRYPCCRPGRRPPRRAWPGSCVAADDVMNCTCIIVYMLLHAGYLDIGPHS